jgi:hypothetical protein
MSERRSSGSPVLERRRTPRWPLRVEVSWSFAGVKGSGKTEDLNAQGFFLCTDTYAPLKALVEFALDLPDQGGPAKVSGRVVRVARRENDTPGFAVEFENIDESVGTRIEALAAREWGGSTPREGS